MNEYRGEYYAIEKLKNAVSFMADLLIPQYVANTGCKIEVKRLQKHVCLQCVWIEK